MRPFMVRGAIPFLSGCPTIVSHKCLAQKSVLHVCDPHMCGTRVSTRSKCPARVSHMCVAKVVAQECCTNVFCQSVLEECRPVSPQNVLQECRGQDLARVSNHGLAV